jgi:hypothetical protein
MVRHNFRVDEYTRNRVATGQKESNTLLRDTQELPRYGVVASL